MTEEEYKAVATRVVALEMVVACLLNHYLNCYETDDGQKNEGMRDALSREAEDLVPNWRTQMAQWRPRGRA